MKWQQQFEDYKLEKARTFLQNRQVTDLKKSEGGYSATVIDRGSLAVTVKIREDGSLRMNCSCPVARGGRNCVHMAAVLYAATADEKKEMAQQGEPGPDADGPEAPKRRGRKAKGLEQKESKPGTAQSAEPEQKASNQNAVQSGEPGPEAPKRRGKKAKGLEQKESKPGTAQSGEAEQKASNQNAAQSEQPEKKAPGRRRLQGEAAEQKAPGPSAAPAEEQKQKAPKGRNTGAEEQKQNAPKSEEANQEEAKQAQERELRRQAREERKAQMKLQKEEQKRQAEEERRRENEKRQAEEARREKIRQEKADEAKRRAEKKQRELEAGQKAALERRRQEEIKAQKLQEEEKLRKAQEEEQRRAEEQKRLEEERQFLEEERQAKELRMRQKRYRTEYEVLGNPWMEEQDSQNQEAGGNSIEMLENYSYFKGTRIKNSVNISPGAFAEGQKLFDQGKIEVQKIFSGFDRRNDEIMGQADAKGIQGKNEFPIRLLFSRTSVQSFNCGCDKCRKDYYKPYSNTSDCPYKAGVLKVVEDWLNTENVGDATDRNGMELMTYYQKKAGGLAPSNAAAREESVNLVPKLLRKESGLSVSFRVGGNKLYVVRKLEQFCDNVLNCATDTYGSNTKINHNPENFTEKGREWIRFIQKIVQEEQELQERFSNGYSYYGYWKSEVGSELNLSGWRLDEFYEVLGDDTVEFEGRDGEKKSRMKLSRAEGNPKVTMRISEEKFSADRDFHGVRVMGSLPELFYGKDTAYYIGGGHLSRVERDFLDKIEPLADMAEYDSFSFSVGRNHLSEFYHGVLPGLKDVVDVTETDPQKFRKFLAPEVRFLFYLDAENGNVTCGVHARYGDKDFSALDVLRRHERGFEPFRDAGREDAVVARAMQWLPEVDWERQELHCGGDEFCIYRMMESGAERLMELGEVRCTRSFRAYSAVRPIRVSVGVSVSSGLLELEIGTQDIAPAELLEILNSYREKKKYYRLKDGSFVNLEDESLEMLAELMDAARLKPREFVKGKMHLPMYRTLYLDKMLEENANVYSSRDSRFREVVKGFKTVTDADFEEPASLSKIMRKYQKNGYKWLRTLETWQFGGILADDMGLGKTLQVISVLLSAKQEGREGTSIVVTPASLVFNWGEELGRFAPQLTVSLITGTQEERQEKIGRYQDYDVIVTSYDLLKRDILHYEDKQFRYEVIDEAQYIKNHTTAAAKAVKLINSQVRYALTGTPIENRLSELWSIFDYLMPGFLYGYDVFRKEMEIPIVKNKEETAMKRLQKMVGPFILRRLKEDVLKDLPEKLEECRYVQFDTVQQRLYDGQVLHMRESIARQGDEEFNRNKMLILAELTRLRQICCDPSLCFDNYDGETAKLEACMELIQSARDGGHRMLVFSQFTSMLEILQKNLEEAGIAYYTITGSVSKEKRLQMVKDFNEGDTPVFLISLKAGGVGLNLTGADVVIHYDPWWNLAVQNQATDRAHRIGQTKKVTVYKLIVKNTIEEKIQKLQETKKDLAEQIIGGETGQLGALSREEILALLEV